MRHRFQFRAFTRFFVLSGLCCFVPCGAQNLGNIWEYAKSCYEWIDLPVASVPDKFSCIDASARPLRVEINTVIHDAGSPNDFGGFPATCDYPVLLPNGGRQCYGNSFIKKLTFGGAAGVEGALLCRHKGQWGKDALFQDVALILTNKSTGKTCWFQTDDGPANKWNGKAIPAPHKVTNHNFWLDTADTAGIECIGCHDNGPFMNSRWMFRAFDGLDKRDQLRDLPGNPYHNSGTGRFEFPGFKDWHPVKFYTPGKTGIPAITPADRNRRGCTSCHKLHARQAAQTRFVGVRHISPAEPNGIWRTRSEWNDFTTGQQFPPGANDLAKDFQIAFWMPEDHGFATPADWNRSYKNHIIFLRACADARGAKGVTDVDTGMEGCKGLVPKDPAPAPPPAPGAGLASIEASLDGGNSWLPPSFVPSAGLEFNISPMTPPNELWIRWSIDAQTFVGCIVEASRFPPGISVSASPGLPAVSTATTWSVDQSPQRIGRLTAPGPYEFAIYCENTAATSVTLNVAGAPAARVRLQALVNNAAQTPAVAPANVGEASTVTTPAPTGSKVNILWTADNVTAGSCRLNRTASGSTVEISRDEYGYLENDAGAAAGDVVYKLSCTGADAVTLTVRVGP